MKGEMSMTAVIGAWTFFGTFIALLIGMLVASESRTGRKNFSNTDSIKNFIKNLKKHK
jgi:hypothetical protein